MVNYLAEMRGTWTWLTTAKYRQPVLQDIFYSIVIILTLEAKMGLFPSIFQSNRAWTQIEFSTLTDLILVLGQHWRCARFLRFKVVKAWEIGPKWQISVFIVLLSFTSRVLLLKGAELESSRSSFVPRSSVRLLLSRVTLSVTLLPKKERKNVFWLQYFEAWRSEELLSYLSSVTSFLFFGTIVATNLHLRLKKSKPFCIVNKAKKKTMGKKMRKCL